MRYAQTDQSLCLSLEYSMTIELLTEHCLEFLSLTEGCTGPSESTLVKMSNCWKSRALAHLVLCPSAISSFCCSNCPSSSRYLVYATPPTVLL